MIAFLTGIVVGAGAASAWHSRAELSQMVAREWRALDVPGRIRRQWAQVRHRLWGDPE